MPGINRNTATCCPDSACFALSGCKPAPPAKGPAGPPVVPVSVAKATQESVPTELRVVGTVEASAIVQVKSQVAGQLLRVTFTEGQNVTKGDLLFEIDPRPYRGGPAPGRSQRHARPGADRAVRSHPGARRRAGQIQPERCRPLRRAAEGRRGLADRNPTRPRPAPTSPANPPAPPRRASRAPRRRSRAITRRLRTAKLNLSLLRDPLAALADAPATCWSTPATW